MNVDAIPYDDRLLRGHRRHLERVAHAKVLAQLVLETGQSVEEEREKKHRQAHTAVDGVALRGIPAIGPGWAGGAIRGTRPGDGLFR